MNSKHATPALLERLADYRISLDDAIALDLHARSTSGNPQPHRNRWLLSSAAAVLVLAGLGALVWFGFGPAVTEPATTTDLIASTSPTVTDADLSTTEPADTATTSSVAESVDPGNPDNPIRRIAIGDQILLGAASDLVDQGWTVDAAASRHPSEAFDLVEEVADRGEFGESVVLHVGTNGPIAPAELDAAMTSLAGVPDVRVLTVTAERSYSRGNNELIRALPDRFSNVSVIDWAMLAAECPGACFYQDGLHLRPDGGRYYAQLLGQAVDAD